MVRLSIIIITQNEEEYISDCLKSADWAEEIVIVDNNSSDRTLEAVKLLKLKTQPKIYTGNFTGYLEQRNFGLRKASGKWLFYLDADERITVELKEEILKIATAENNSAYFYSVPRQNLRFGKYEVKHGGWYPDYVRRLFQKKCLEGWRGEVHESPIIKFKIQNSKFKNSTAGYLKNPLVHLGRNFDRIFAKTMKWSKTEADLLFSAGHPAVNIFRLSKVTLEEFFRRYIWQKGFLDGKIGLMEAVYQSFSRLVTYSRLWELQNKDKLKP